MGKQQIEDHREGNLYLAIHTLRCRVQEVEDESWVLIWSGENNNETHFVHAATAGPPSHLKQISGIKRNELASVEAITLGKYHTAGWEIDTSSNRLGRKNGFKPSLFHQSLHHHLPLG